MSASFSTELWLKQIQHGKYLISQIGEISESCQHNAMGSGCIQRSDHISVVKNVLVVLVVVGNLLSCSLIYHCQDMTGIGATSTSQTEDYQKIFP